METQAPSGEPQEPEEATEASASAEQEEAHTAAPEESEGEAPDELGRVRREAADRRVRLREVEAERDTLRGQVAALQRAEVERLAAERLADPTDLWLGGIELDSLLADDGTPDSELVAQAANAVVKAHPSWSRPMPDFGAGPRPGPATGPSFGAALKRGGR